MIPVFLILYFVTVRAFESLNINPKLNPSSFPSDKFSLKKLKGHLTLFYYHHYTV